MSRREVAERLSISVSTVKNLEARGLPVVKVGAQVRVRESDLKKIIAQGTGGA